jgi:hypothetical protein
MTGKEHLYAYYQLILHGCTPEEAPDIIEEIKVKMENDKSKNIPLLNNEDKSILEIVKELSNEN